MKKILIIVASIICLGSCVKAEPEYDTGHFTYFRDEYSVGDTLFYYTNINVGIKEAEIYCISKTIHNKDSVTISRKSERYSMNEFKIFMRDKNNEHRKSPILQLLPNMYCTWDLFDRVYTECIIPSK